MSAAPVDLTIRCRFMLPMSSPHEVLEHHTLVVRDGRILDILPCALAAERYVAAVHVDRLAHLLLPGLVNAYTRIAPPPGRSVEAECLEDGARACLTEMLAAGTSCFCSVGDFPHESAGAATAVGMRALIGIPIAEAASSWAQSAGEYLTRALKFRDEYRGHRTIATAFALEPRTAISDLNLGRIATLADELDAGIMTPLHESRAAVEESSSRYGLRPIERLSSLGLLTPALTAVHMVAVDAADLQRAERSGIGVVLCPEANLRSGNGAPPVAAWAATGLRLGLGSGVAGSGGCMDLWTAMRLLALLSQSEPHPASAWDALDIATRGGAAALGLDAEIGTLERGKWADLCCVDLDGPAMHGVSHAPPEDVVTQLVYNGGRDLVSDVWVAGRALLEAGTFTRLDGPLAAARLRARRHSPITGDD
jgi:5-methylthioadenosine/S-adenosylhomocysteine deaminase